eukprot:1010370-Prymnesium_polylepis.2
MAYGKGGRQRAVVGGRDVGLRHDLVVRVKETVGLRGADARMRAHCRRDGARRRAPSCAAHSGVVRAAGSDGLGWKRYGIRNTHERGDARWGGDARTPGYPGGQRANLLTILANLRAAAQHQRSTALARLRVTWAPPGIAPWLEAGP